MRAFFLTILCAGMFSFAQEWDFRYGGMMGFLAANFTESQMIPDEGFQGTGGEQSLIYSPKMSIDADFYKCIELDMESEGTSLRLYFSRPDSPMSEAQYASFSPSKEYPRVYVDFSDHPEWHGTVDQFRLDLLNRNGQHVTLRSIRLLPRHPAKSGIRTGLLVNGAFQFGLARWNGPAALTPEGGALLPPGKELVSDPVELSRICSMNWEAECQGRHEIWFSFQDILGNDLESTPPSGEDSGAFRPDELAATVRLHIQNAGREPLTISRLCLTNDVATGCPLGGNWVMDPDSTPGEPFVNLFRCDVLLDNPQELDYALVAATADDVLDCAVNGQPLAGSGAKLWSSVDCFDVTRYLVQGQNAILFRAENLGGPGGLLAQVILVWKDGTRTVYDSSYLWRSATLKREDTTWTTRDATSVPVVLGKAGEPPWAPLTYDEASALKAVVASHNMPSQVTQEDTWTPQFLFRFPDGPQTRQRQDLEFSIYLVEGTMRILVAEEVFLAHTFDGKESWEVTLPTVYFRYLNQGDYQVRCTLGSDCLDASALPGTLRIRQTRPLTHAIPQTTLTDRATTPRLALNGEAPRALTHYLLDTADSPAFYRGVKRALDSGVPGIWIHTTFRYRGNGQCDMSAVENMVQSILARNPEANIVLTPLLDSSENSGFEENFFNGHPEAVCQDSDGRDRIVIWNGRSVKCPSLASEEWLSECEMLLDTQIRRLDQTPWGQRLAGIIPCSGLSYEWMYWGTQSPGLFVDYGPAFRKAFAQYAREKYQTIGETNRRWNTTFRDFAEIVVPTPQQRMASGDGVLKTPAQDQYTIDFTECLAQVTARAVERLCAAVKRSSQGRLLSGAYYGYVNYLTSGDYAQKSGHWDLQRLLRSPNVDVLMSPTRYSDRLAGGGGGFMIPIGSLHLHDKVYIDESDIRTPMSDGDYQACSTLQETKAVFAREFGATLAARAVYRSYDFSKGWAYRDTRLAQLLQNLNRAEAEFHEEDLGKGFPRREETIAVINADNAAAMTSMSSPLNECCVSRQYEELLRTGCPFLTYLLSDLEEIPAGHRYWLFENAVSLTDSQRQYIQDNLMVPGNTLVFVYGAGVIDSQEVNPDQMGWFLGMQFQKDDRSQSRKCALTALGQELLGNGNPADDTWECGKPLAPVFYPVGNCSPLAMDGEGNALLAERDVNGCRVLFATLPALPARWLRPMAVAAGVHCYNDTPEDVTWAAGDLVTVHTAKGGERILHGHCQTGTATELVTGRTYPIQDGLFRYDAEPMSTAIFLLRENPR